MKQVTGLTVLLQESRCFNSIFNPLDECAQRLEPKYLPFASKISLKKQFFLELNICTSHSVLKICNMGPWRSCYVRKSSFWILTGYTKQKTLSNHKYTDGAVMFYHTSAQPDYSLHV